MAAITHGVLILTLGAVSVAAHPGGTRHPADSGRQAQTPPVNEMAKVMAAFTERVAAYAALQEKLASSLPKLPTEATPQQIDSHQRALAALVAKARPAARRGDLFTPDMQAVVRDLMARTFKQPRARAQLRASIAEENPRGLKLTVNGRYPDVVPLATMPPEVLQNLPPLPKELEYRFVGNSLILLDARAHLVVDFMPRALPAA